VVPKIRYHFQFLIKLKEKLQALGASVVPNVIEELIEKVAGRTFAGRVVGLGNVGERGDRREVSAI
jgi:hypothetical protein